VQVDAVPGNRFAVAAAHPAVVSTGLETMSAGGNALDAVIAAAFTAFVVEPVSAGLGGYGRLSSYDAETGRFLTVNHGPRAPQAATPHMFTPDTLTRDTPTRGELTGDAPWPGVQDRANEVGARAIAVPGAVPGLAAAHARAGRLPFADLLEPAIVAAERGIEITWREILPIVRHLAVIRRTPPAAAYLLDTNGDPPPAGRRLDASALTQTLKIIRNGGVLSPDITTSIARQVQAQGGLLTAEDLTGYRPKVLEEEPARFGTWRYVTAHDHVGYETLQILAGMGPSDPGSAEHHHQLTEAMATAFTDGAAWYGDPDFVASPYEGLRSERFAAARRADLAKAHRPVASRGPVASRRPVASRGPHTPGDPWRYQPGGRPAPATAPGGNRGRLDGTTQICAVDADGNTVALITTVGQDFGSLTYVPEAGIFLNSSMNNFDPRPGMPNSIAPGKMPLFGVPAIVATDDATGATLAIGGSGGWRILSGVTHAFVNLTRHGLPVAEAVSAPRSHCQGGPTYLDERLDPGIAAELAARGHEVVVQRSEPGREPFARVSAVTSSAQRHAEAASDPPWSTSSGSS
jgi:gamma-glutamyltranspeptidase/glutathione hydrolase